MDWRVWMYGLAHAVVLGAANTVTTIAVDPDKFNLSSWSGFIHVMICAGAGAFFGFWFYLKQSPLPALVETTVTTQKTTTVSEKSIEVPPAVKN